MTCSPSESNKRSATSAQAVHSSSFAIWDVFVCGLPVKISERFNTTFSQAGEAVACQLLRCLYTSRASLGFFFLGWGG